MTELEEYKIHFSLTFFRQGMSWALVNWIVSWGKEEDNNNV